MRIREIYEMAIKEGIEADPRGREGIKKLLEQKKKEYENLPKEEKEFINEDLVKNPFVDSQILVGDPEIKVKAVAAGIDMEVGEILLVDRLRDKGEKVDLIIAHHPEGTALAAISEVMPVQADVWHKYGVPINIGDYLIGKRMGEVHRALMPVNHQRAVDAAKILEIPFMCLHTVCDNLVTSHLQKIFDKEMPYTLKDVLEKMRAIPEYKTALKLKAGPNIIVGDEKKRAGKVMVDMTGGTEGPQESIEKLAQAGVGTIIHMHMADKIKEEAEKYHLNVIIAGHIASDSIGMNLFLDKLEKKGIKILSCSGLIRVKR